MASNCILVGEKPFVRQMEIILRFHNWIKDKQTHHVITQVLKKPQPPPKLLKMKKIKEELQKLKPKFSSWFYCSTLNQQLEKTD
ncbi:MAG: hypothetical protein AAB838_01795 [Patescibacteria group bacterium]